MPLFFEILIRKDGVEKWVDSRKLFKYLLEDYSKVSYKGKVADPYNARVEKFYSNIPQHLLDSWMKAYPNCNIPEQLRKCEAWLLSNTNKAKKDVKRFTNNWLNRAMENGGNIPVQVDLKIESEIKKHKEYMERAEEESATPEEIQKIIRQTKKDIRQTKKNMAKK